MSRKDCAVFTVTWKIEAFSLNNLQCGNFLESPVFRVEQLNATKWCLRLYPKGFNEAHRDFVSCFLYRVFTDVYEPDLLVSFSLGITDLHGNILKSFKVKDKSVTKSGYGDYKFFPRQELCENLKNWKEDTLVVSCLFFDQNVENLITQCDIHTTILEKKCSFKWKMIIPGTPNWSKSLKFLFDDKILFKIDVALDERYILFQIKNSSLLELDTTYKVTFSLLNDRGASINLVNPNHVFDSTLKNNYLKVASFVKIKNVVNEISSPCMHPFTLLCAIQSSSSTSAPSSYSVEYNFDSTIGDVSKTLDKSCPSLQEDLKNLLLNEKHCDLKLQTKGKTVPAHKSMLCARSHVFSAMFDRDMRESQTGVVDIQDVDYETLLSFLEFLYTDTLTNTAPDHVLKLILVAEKYQVNTLKKRCTEILMTKISIQNVYKVISVAELINLPNLKSRALDYVKAKNPFII